MTSRHQTKKTVTISLFAAGLLAAANAVTLTSAANALTSHTDGLQSSPMVTTTTKAMGWQVAEAKEDTKKKKKKKRHGSFYGG